MCWFQMAFEHMLQIFLRIICEILQNPSTNCSKLKVETEYRIHFHSPLCFLITQPSFFHTRHSVKRIHVNRALCCSASQLSHVQMWTINHPDVNKHRCEQFKLTLWLPSLLKLIFRFTADIDYCQFSNCVASHCHQSIHVDDLYKYFSCT